MRKSVVIYCCIFSISYSVGCSMASKQDKMNKAGYKYPHDYGGYVEQQYLPDKLVGKIYYQPKNNGYETVIKQIRKKKGKKD